MMKFFELFYSFLKIGLFTFGGGYAMIPIIEREVIHRKHWIQEQEFFDLLTLAQSAPGPISLNASVFVGYKMHGYRGALAALLGVALPSFLIILIVAIFFSQIRENPIIDAAFKGMRPVVVALMFAPVVGLAKGMKWWAMAVAGAVALAVWSFGFSPIYLLIIAAVAGLLWAARRGKEVER